MYNPSPSDFGCLTTILRLSPDALCTTRHAILFLSNPPHSAAAASRLAMLTNHPHFRLFTIQWHPRDLRLSRFMYAKRKNCATNDLARKCLLAKTKRWCAWFTYTQHTIWKIGKIIDIAANNHKRTHTQIHTYTYFIHSSSFEHRLNRRQVNREKNVV